MKNFKEFREDLESIASGGIQVRDNSPNTSSDNLQAQALQKRKERSSEMANRIKERQLRQQQINKQKRENK